MSDGNSGGSSGGGSASHSNHLVGTRLGDYQVMRKLGRGGMADVYAARHLSLGRDVALKILRSDFAKDDDYVRRFRREAQAAARLNHPNIVQVFDVGNLDSTHFIAQELVDGENLRVTLDREGALPSDQALDVLVSVALALQIASEAGITHRDIKPENIIRSSNGVIKVADFGLASVRTSVEASRADLTQAGLTLGTPRYMSPEQVQGQSVDVRSDLYSLGVTMYHLISGRPPFEAEDPLALAVMHLHETPAPVDRVRNANGISDFDVPDWLIAVISRLMNKSPQDRFQTAADLLAAVDCETGRNGGRTVVGIGAEAATIRLQRATDRAREDSQRHRKRTVAMIALPILCGGFVAWVARRGEQRNVSDLLRPDTIARSESVDEQYLVAAIRNDEAGWRAVGQNFASEENSINASYHAKSMLQLARLMLSQQRFRESDQVLEELLSNPNTNRVYQALALVQKCLILKQIGGNAGRLSAAREQLRSLYAEMKLNSNNPAALELFQKMVPQNVRTDLLGVPE